MNAEDRKPPAGTEAAGRFRLRSQAKSDILISAFSKRPKTNGT